MKPKPRWDRYEAYHPDVHPLNPHPKRRVISIEEYRQSAARQLEVDGWIREQKHAPV